MSWSKKQKLARTNGVNHNRYVHLCCIGIGVNQIAHPTCCESQCYLQYVRWPRFTTYVIPHFRYHIVYIIVNHQYYMNFQ